MDECGDCFLQGERNGVLLGQGGDMDETYAGGGAGKVVEQEIERIVADEGTGTVGDSAGDAGIANGLGHGSHGNSGKVGGGTVG